MTMAYNTQHHQWQHKLKSSNNKKLKQVVVLFGWNCQISYADAGITSSEGQIVMGDILVMPTQCTGKYITYNCSRRQRVAWLLQPFTAAKICRQTYIDRWIHWDRMTENKRQQLTASVIDKIRTVTKVMIIQVTYQRQRGLKRKCSFVCPYMAPPAECYYNTIMFRLLFFVVECGIARFLCAMRVFEVRASSSSPTLPLCQILCIWRPPLLSQHMEKIVYSITQSLTQLI